MAVENSFSRLHGGRNPTQCRGFGELGKTSRIDPGRLVREVQAALREGKTVEELLGSSQLGADPFLEGFHRMNLVQTYKEESARLGDSSQSY